MDERISSRCIIHGLYKHFKGGIYRLESIAMHTETGETDVVYTCIKPGKNTNCKCRIGDTFVRPYDMFFSEVDHEKYPDVKQKYRMELWEGEE